MTVLYVILGIIAFIIILLFCPVSFHLLYSEDKFNFNVCYLFLKFRLAPAKEKNNRSEKNEDKNGTSENKSRNLNLDFIKQKGIGGLTELLKSIVNLLKGLGSSLKKHIIISELNVDILVVGDDAADTAMKYGYVCSAVYPIISFIDNQVKRGTHSENISAGFDNSEGRTACAVSARIRLIYIIKNLISAAFKALRILLNNRRL